MTAETLINKYNLLPHPEGGWYKETYKSKESVCESGLPKRFNGERVFSTAIYFLLEQGNFSAFHRIKSDECWHFYAGGTLLVYIIHEDARLEIVRLGNHPNSDETFQFVVPANCWFASIPDTRVEFCFVGCTVSPGFDFNDFELADKNELMKHFPQYADIIEKLTR